jgi:hypothetical protein
VEVPAKNSTATQTSPKNQSSLALKSALIVQAPANNQTVAQTPTKNESSKAQK